MLSRKSFLRNVSALGAGLTLPAFGAETRRMKVAVLKGSDVFSGRSEVLLASCRAGGITHALVDVQSTLAYPSHPQIAMPGSVAAEKVSAQVSDWNRRGVSVVPLLDFTTSRDSWLGIYDRMVCSKAYDRLVGDLIRDAFSVFCSPAFIHVGLSNEDRETHPTGSYAVMRQGDLWMRYLVMTTDLVKATGARAWAWFDYPWGMKDFLAGCPRDVVYSNFKPLSHKRPPNKFGKSSTVFERFSLLAKNGCELVTAVHTPADAALAATLPADNVLGEIAEGLK